MTIRISLVAYLNAAALGWAFLHTPLKDGFEVIPASPARCADQLARGEVEIGVIPSIEYQRIGNLSVALPSARRRICDKLGASPSLEMGP